MKKMPRKLHFAAFFERKSPSPDSKEPSVIATCLPSATKKCPISKKIIYIIKLFAHINSRATPGTSTSILYIIKFFCYKRKNLPCTDKKKTLQCIISMNKLQFTDERIAVRWRIIAVYSWTKLQFIYEQIAVHWWIIALC